MYLAQHINVYIKQGDVDSLRYFTTFVDGCSYGIHVKLESIFNFEHLKYDILGCCTYYFNRYIYNITHNINSYIWIVMYDVYMYN